MPFIFFFIFCQHLLHICNSSIVFGVVTVDSAMLTSSSNLTPGGVTLINDFEHIQPVGDRILVSFNGDVSDCSFLLARLQEENRQYNLAFGRDMSCKSLAYYCRRKISDVLRSQPLKVNLLIAGWDIEYDVPVMYWLDGLGAIQRVENGAAHGREFVSILSLIDHYFIKTSNSKSEDIYHTGNAQSIIFFAQLTISLFKPRNTNR
jgi:20S proteasome alpha/beta subunit